MKVQLKLKNLSLPVICFFMIAFSFVPIVWVSAQQATPSDDEVNAIARQLFCPVCENTPLDVCPTQACHEWRELIRQMLAEGKAPNEIRQYFADHYGARVLAEPPIAGINWLVYVIPTAAILIGIFLLFRAFWSWKQAPKRPAKVPISVPEPAKEDEYASCLEEELQKRE